jgi:hypothetical protein
VNLPMDAALRAQVLRVIAAYKTKQVRFAVPLGNEELLAAQMEAVSGMIASYDNHEMSPTLQKKIFRTLKTFRKRFPVAAQEVQSEQYDTRSTREGGHERLD